MSTPITLVAGTYPQGYCPADYQELLTDLPTYLTGNLPGTYNVYNFGNSEPAVEDRDKPWLKTDANLVPERWYTYDGDASAWTWPHPFPQGIIVIWMGSIENLDTFDGGDTDPAGTYAGPMWEEVTELRAAFPLGAGTLPISGTVVGDGDTGGLEKVELTEDNLAQHRHFCCTNTVNGTPFSKPPSSVQAINAATIGSAASGDDDYRRPKFSNRKGRLRSRPGSPEHASLRRRLFHSPHREAILHCVVMKVEKQIKITRDDGSELILSEEEIEKVKALLDLKPEVIRVRVPEPYPVYRWNRPWVPYDIYNSSDASGQIDCNVGDGVFVSSGENSFKMTSCSSSLT